MSQSKPILKDVVVLGGGAAGLMAAITAGQRQRSVTLLEKTNKLGKKILMSGGGRCNFTNLHISANEFLCANPHFVKSALAQYTQWDFIALVQKHGIAYHEKVHGQLFCDHSAKEILAMLVQEAEDARVELSLSAEVIDVSLRAVGFEVNTTRETYHCESLIVATGGLSIPTLGGASGLAYQIAERFGLSVTNRCASLVPFTLTGKLKELSESLSGVSHNVTVSVPTKGFTENLLFTHRGISGPAILQITNYWRLGEMVSIDLFPDISEVDLLNLLLESKQTSPNKTVTSVLASHMPFALAKELAPIVFDSLKDSPLQSIKRDELKQLAYDLKHWCIKPSGTEGYRTAEVTLGGVSTERISSKTMECQDHSGLFFVGEALDVTGHLGGYNFQWAWSSGFVAGSYA